MISSFRQLNEPTRCTN